MKFQSLNTADAKKIAVACGEAAAKRQYHSSLWTAYRELAQKIDDGKIVMLEVIE